jgi:hypothetical protein
MNEGIRPKAVLFSVAILAAGLWAQSAIAEDCAPIIKAEEATLTAPGFRQYLVPAASTGSSERLMSISLGDTAYLALGTSNGWEKMKRVEIIAMAKEAEDDASYRDCQSLGSQSVGSVEALGYGFLMERKSGRFEPKRAKIWVGPDGFVRLQESGGMTLRYEYDNVQAPVP